ncbi:hypothetical protein Tco_1108963 [Tanacetum coccineum]
MHSMSHNKYRRSINSLLCQSNGQNTVTKRLDTTAGKWHGWNWRSEGNLLLNGAYFTPSALVTTSSGVLRSEHVHRPAFCSRLPRCRPNRRVHVNGLAAKSSGHISGIPEGSHIMFPSVKPADKLSSMIWEEKHEHDGPPQNLNADNAYHI